MSRLIQQYLLLILLGLYVSTGASAQIPFQKVYGHVDGGSQGNAIILTNSGGYAIAGWYDVDGLFSAEFYLILIDAAGDTLWTKTYGESVSDFNETLNGSGNEGFNLVQTADNGFMLIGERHKFTEGPSDVYAVKIDETGTLQWSRTYGGADNDYGIAVHQTADDDYVIGGFSESYGAGIRDMYLLKLDNSGDTLWTRTYGGTSIDAANDMQQTSDGGFILTGYTFSYGAGSSDIYVIKTAANGDVLWQHTYGGDLNDIGHAVIETQDGGFILCGETESFGAGNQDVYLTKVNSMGDIEWSKTYGGENFEAGKSIAQAEDGGYIIAGYTRGFGAEGEDFFLIKTDQEGEITWSKRFGGSFDETAQSVKQTQDGGYILSGQTRSFGVGNSNVYLIKTDGGGNGGCLQSTTTPQVNDVPTIKMAITSTVGYGTMSSQPITLVGNTNTEYSDPCEDIVGSIENSKSNTLKIYPNPSSSYLKIEGGDNNSFIDKHIKIYDVLGQLVKSYTLINSEDEIDISMLSNGVFILNVLIEDQYVSFKFVKN